MLIVAFHCVGWRLSPVLDFLKDCMSEPNIAIGNYIQAGTRSVRCAVPWYFIHPHRPSSQNQRGQWVTSAVTPLWQPYCVPSSISKTGDDTSFLQMGTLTTNVALFFLSPYPGTCNLLFRQIMRWGLINKLPALWLHGPLTNHHHLRRSGIEKLGNFTLTCSIPTTYDFKRWCWWRGTPGGQGPLHVFAVFWTHGWMGCFPMMNMNIFIVVCVHS